ncbi:MAG: adhesin, partial [Planctomycetota bacterium]
MIHRQPSETSTARSGKRRPRPSKRRDRFGDKRRLTLEGLENRQLLAGGLGLIANNGTLEEFDGPRNVGTVTAFQVNEDEGIGDFGENDFFQDAQEVPLGLMPGQQDTIDIRGTAGFETRGNVSFTTDIDTYAVNLKAGDILDVATIGASTQFTVLLGLNESGGRIQGRTEGSIWFGVDGDPNVIGEEQSTTYPANSPLQTFGEQAFAQVVPESGTYYIQVAANTTTINYTLGLRVYRPVTESLPIGERQIVFLDFDGGVFPRDLLTALYTDENAPVGGIVRLPDLQETLSDNGFAGVSDAQYQFFVRQIINKFEAAYENIGDRNLNGDFVSTGIPGDYAVTVLNSIDHPDPGSAPNVSRIQMSGTEADYGFSALIAESVDVGNFLLNEYAVVQFDVIAGLSADFPVESIGRLEAIGTFMANVAIHEAGHIFGMRHTDGENPTATLSDEGGSVNSFSQLQEVGNDGIAGTIDDELLLFETDRFSLLEGIFGTNFIGSSLAFGLSTGTEGTLPTGTVFGDEAGDGSSLGDSGLPDVTLFMDLDRDGIQDPGEPATVSASDGSYSFAAPQSVFTTNPGPDIYAIVPSNFESSNVSPLNTRTITDLSGTSRTAVRA